MDRKDYKCQETVILEKPDSDGVKSYGCWREQTVYGVYGSNIGYV